MTIYDILIDFGIASILILLGQLLRAKVVFIQKFFMPASLIAGFAGLLLGPQVFNVLPFSKGFGTYAGMLIILVFVVIGINGYQVGKSGQGKAEIKRLWSYNNYKEFLFFLQFCFPITVTLLYIKYFMPELNPGFGMLMASGFVGGHGTAAAVGKTFAALGWSEAIDLGMTFATIGILTGVFGGLMFIKWATKKGYTSYIEDFAYISGDLRTGLVEEKNRISMGNETTSSVSLDSLCFHMSLVLGIAGFGYWLNSTIIGPHLIKGIPDFTVGFLVSLLFFVIFSRTGVYNYVDKRVTARIAGTATDYLVFFGIAAIKITIIIKYAVPLLILTICGFICVFLTVLPFGYRMNNSSWFERSIFCYGYATGVYAIGFVLLRIVDPENKSKTIEDTALVGPIGSFMEIGVWSTIPAALMLGKGYYVVGITAILTVGFLLASIVTGCWYKTPLKDRKRLGIDDVQE